MRRVAAIPAAMLALALLAPAVAREGDDAIAIARARVDTLRKAQAAAERQAPELALATGGGIADVAHRRILADALRREADRQDHALSDVLAAEWRTGQAVRQSTDAGSPDAGAAGGTMGRLAALPLLPLPPGSSHGAARLHAAPLYRLPARGRLLTGTGERTAAGVAARGITLATAPGLPVVAPGAGRVRYAGPFGAYGDIVILDHGRGWTTLVAGLDRASVAVGDDLLPGVAIGRTTGRLIVELRHRGRVADIVGMAALLDR